MYLTQKSGIIMGTLAKLLGLIMTAIYNAFSSVGIENIAICIIVFTVVVRLIMYPLSLQSTRSSKVQKFLQPEFNKINKKYRGKKDQDSMLKQQKETRELQEKYGIKMTAGCLTSFIQLPIFFSLYYVIQNIPAYVSKVKDMYLPIANAINSVGNHTDMLTTFGQEHKIVVNTLADGNINGIIDVLSKCNSTMWDELKVLFASSPDVVNAINSNVDKINDINTFILGINMAEAPGLKFVVDGSFHWPILIPILSMVFQFLSMLTMPDQPASDPQQEQTMQMMKTMTRVMPIMSFFVCIGVPAGVGLYWAIGALISFLTSWLTNLYYDKCDMQKIVDKQVAKAAKKLEKKKKSGKKSFMEKLTEAAYGNQEADKAPVNMEKYTSTKLKNYTASISPSSLDKGEKSDSKNSSSAGAAKNVTYKAGSIAAKANALKQYNEKGGNKE